MNAAPKRGGWPVPARFAVLVAVALTICYLGWRAYRALGPAAAAPEPPSLDDSVTLTARARAYHEAAQRVEPQAKPPQGKEGTVAPPPLPPRPVAPPPPLPPTPAQLANPPRRPSVPADR